MDDYGLYALQELDNKLLKLSILKTKNNDAFKFDHEKAYEYFLYKELSDLLKNIAASGETKGFKIGSQHLAITPITENTFYVFGGDLGMLKIDFSCIMSIEDNRISFEGIKGINKIAAIFTLSVVFGMGTFNDPEKPSTYSEWKITDDQILNYMNIFVSGIENEGK